MTAQPRRALTSTVSAATFVLATTVGAALIGGLVLAAASVTASAVAVAVVAVTAASVVAGSLPTRVSVGVTAAGIRYRRPGGRQRWIPAESIVAAEAVRVGYGAIVGWGIPATRATDRRIVRAGWTLHLRLCTREEIWLSTRGPLDAGSILRPPVCRQETGEPSREDGRS